MYSMRFDMRAPDFGASPVELYEAAVDMCEWAETRGCLAVVICEHHSSPDGYLPTPLILGSAIAARTKQLMMTLIVIVPFYDPVRLAEEIAVLDLISKGRGLRLRAWLSGGGIPAFRARPEGSRTNRRREAWSASPSAGRRGGGTGRPANQVDAPAGLSARTANDVGRRQFGGCPTGRSLRTGLSCTGRRTWSQQAYEEACRAHGHEPGMTLLPNRDTPSVCFVAPDVDVAWQELGEHLLHDARMYAEWNPDNQTSAGIADVSDVEELRATSRTHRIFTADEAITYVRGGGMLTLAPLCGGIPPDIAWKYLRYVDEAVMPALRTNDD
jgi:hypothetical protein